jgi:hypothetical protein
VNLAWQLNDRAIVQIGPSRRLCVAVDERDREMSKPKDIDLLFNDRHLGREVIVLCVRWYRCVRCPSIAATSAR